MGDILECCVPSFHRTRYELAHTCAGPSGRLCKPLLVSAGVKRDWLLLVTGFLEGLSASS